MKFVLNSVYLIQEIILYKLGKLKGKERGMQETILHQICQILYVFRNLDI